MTNLDDLISGGHNGWAEEYKKLFGLPLSDSDRFFRSLDLYGPFPVYEAMIISSLKKFDKDPLGYVLAVAHAKWKEQVEEQVNAQRYEMRIQMAKERSLEYNRELRDKIEKARRKMHKNDSNSGSVRG